MFAAVLRFFAHVAVMPDVHWGLGATVGSVIATEGAVIPAAVGVDLGCGMLAARTNLRAENLPDDLGPLRSAIENAIPHGRTNHGGDGDRGAWHNVPVQVAEAFAAAWSNVPGNFATNDRLAKRAEHQLGTLGTGNHFVEICLDTGGDIWIMLHSGSRGIGNALASEYISEAKKQAAKYGYESFLPDAELAWLNMGTPVFTAYINAVRWAQEYAQLNRVLMLGAVRGALVKTGLDHGITTEIVNCHHNYVAFEKHFDRNVIVTRKGAVRAGDGELGIIPGSMGAKSFIVRGKGNAEAFSSCSHGAGRRMGRQEARKRISMADFNAAMGDVESRRDEHVLDEAPQAYKDIDAVIATQSDLIDVVYTLKQVLCVKG